MYVWVCMYVYIFICNVGMEGWVFGCMCMYVINVYMYGRKDVCVYACM